MDDSKRLLIADALTEIVEKARRGGPICRIGLMAAGSELGQEELLRGARIAQEENPSLRVVAIGPRAAEYGDLEWVETSDCEADIVAAVERALGEGTISGLVAMHYPFPIGVATIGRVMTPAKGLPMFIASCTGSTATGRSEALLRNAVYGIATAKACGIEKPTVAFLNIDGAGSALRALTQMRNAGYSVDLGSSERGDGGSLLRGNDIISGCVDVLVCDTLTGNVLVKMLSAFTTGGRYESVGWGYGPSTGEGWDKVVSIVSRASGASVVAGSLALTAKAVRSGLPQWVVTELKAARAAGFDIVLENLKPKAEAAEAFTKPSVVPVDAEIAGVDVMDMENAMYALWKEKIYAETAMGCTGPVVRVQKTARETAVIALKKAGFL